MINDNEFWLLCWGVAEEVHNARRPSINYGGLDMTPEEQCAVIQAKARGEKIERQSRLAAGVPWLLMKGGEAFNFGVDNYRIAATSPNKRRAECWDTGSQLIFSTCNEAFNIDRWKRVPALDKEWEE